MNVTAERACQQYKQYQPGLLGDSGLGELEIQLAFGTGESDDGDRNKGRFVVRADHTDDHFAGMSQVGRQELSKNQMLAHELKHPLACVNPDFALIGKMISIDAQSGLVRSCGNM